jgi:hypothetical protein
MLGVRREGITQTAGKLPGAGLIQYQCGPITVFVRKALEARTCECFQVVKIEFHHFPPYVINQGV